MGLWRRLDGFWGALGIVEGLKGRVSANAQLRSGQGCQLNSCTFFLKMRQFVIPLVAGIEALLAPLTYLDEVL